MGMVNKIAKRIVADVDDCREALADYLGVEVEEVTPTSYSEHCFTTAHDGEYAVYEDYESANDAAIESVENLLEECGVECVNGWENFINTDYFDYDRQNYWDDYARDIAREDDEKFGNRLVQEAYEFHVIDDDDFNEDEETGDIDYTDCKKSIDELVDLYGNYCYEDDDPIDWITQCYPKGELLEHCPGCVKLRRGRGGYEHRPQSHLP